ncbi:MAG: DUF4347 domain-containing protein [Oscillatoriales cyanobacterium C42_A2020_001]|nr:DUF4347 domain-containing protein [Leptolyngbyaceae cyanobacterium C42_A2020_001]
MPPASQKVTQLVIVDGAIANLQTFTTGLYPDTAVLLLDPEHSGIAAITHTLAHYSQIQALHIVSHGDVARLQLGSDRLTLATLPTYQSQLQQWQHALAPKSEVLLYGCNVAQGKQGETFVRSLGQQLHTPIAASTDLTGYSVNWNLEFKTGTTQTQLAFAPSTLDSYSGTLKQLQLTTTNDEGKGSLRWAIAQANATPEDDVIDLSQVSGAIALQSPLPAITGNLFIRGDSNDILSGENRHRVLTVERGDVTLSHLTIANGLAQGSAGVNGAGGAAGMGGGLLMQDGTVTLNDVAFLNNQAVGGNGTAHTQETGNQIVSDKNSFEVNRGGIIGINGISSSDSQIPTLPTDEVKIATNANKFNVNRGAIANVNGIGLGGIGSIAFGGGGGFGGFGNAGNGLTLQTICRAG